MDSKLSCTVKKTLVRNCVIESKKPSNLAVRERKNDMQIHMPTRLHVQAPAGKDENTLKNSQGVQKAKSMQQQLNSITIADAQITNMHDKKFQLMPKPKLNSRLKVKPSARDRVMRSEVKLHPVALEFGPHEDVIRDLVNMQVLEDDATLPVIKKKPFIRKKHDKEPSIDAYFRKHTSALDTYPSFPHVCIPFSPSGMYASSDINKTPRLWQKKSEQLLYSLSQD